MLVTVFYFLTGKGSKKPSFFLVAVVTGNYGWGFSASRSSFSSLAHSSFLEASNLHGVLILFSPEDGKNSLLEALVSGFSGVLILQTGAFFAF